jgi:hypothetical protein
MVADCLVRILVSKDNRALGGWEIRLAANHQDIEGTELLAVKLLHLVFHDGNLLSKFKLD